MNALLLTGVWRSLLSWFCLLDAVAVLSHKDNRLINRSSDGVVTLGLPGLALDENDFVCEILSGVLYSVSHRDFQFSSV